MPVLRHPVRVGFADGKRVGFGRVIDGLRLMKMIDRVETDAYQRPRRAIKIESCAMWTPTPEEEEGEERRGAVATK